MHKTIKQARLNQKQMIQGEMLSKFSYMLVLKRQVKHFAFIKTIANTHLAINLLKMMTS